MKMEFWPPRATHSVHMLTLMPPPALPPRLWEDICRMLSLVASLVSWRETLRERAPSKTVCASP